MMGSKKIHRAVGLFSGGLDSILALRLVADQGIRVTALHMRLPFADDAGLEELEAQARELGAGGFLLYRPGEEFCRVLENPRHGYGKNANPCLDCKLLLLRRAGALMEETGAAFVFTGEVLGERPMSQRRQALDLLERESGLKGRLLRPLSAKLLPPTEAELTGVVDRELLKDFRGRGRKPQMALAAELGVSDYPSPAGGCLLTEPVFGRRVFEMLGHEGCTVEGLRLLPHGRHFRLPSGSRLALGRDAADNEALLSAAAPGDLLLDARVSSPVGVLRHPSGEVPEGDLELAAALVAGYAKPREGPTVPVHVARLTASGEDFWGEIAAAPSDRFDPTLRRLMV
jgi:tRNA-specific 2-thiouridylase